MSPKISCGADPLHFALPAELRHFTRFSKLPYDIRHKIWQSIIYTPGIHFLKYERNNSWKPSMNPEAEMVGAPSANFDAKILAPFLDAGDLSDFMHRNFRKNHGRHRRKPKVDPSTMYSGTLKPIFEIPHGDKSYYHTAFKTMTTLSYTSAEARDHVYQAINQLGTLCLDNGTIISLANSSDVICIDYPELLTCQNLGMWTRQLNPHQLAQMRRVAVRYQPLWDGLRRYCRACGGYHHAEDDSIGSKPPRRHLYEFAALFPNLETFYLLDATIVRGTDNNSHQNKNGHNETNTDERWVASDDCIRTMNLMGGGDDGTQKGEQFLSGDRTYFEMDHDLCRVCKIHSNVFQMLEWVREKYIELCEDDSVWYLRRKKHSNPRSVRFSILGCEWNQEKLVQEKKKSPSKGEMTSQRLHHMKKRDSASRHYHQQQLQPSCLVHHQPSCLVHHQQHCLRTPPRMLDPTMDSATHALNQLELSSDVQHKNDQNAGEQWDGEQHNGDHRKGDNMLEYRLPVVFGAEEHNIIPFTFRVSLRRAITHIPGGEASHPAVWYARRPYSNY